VINAFLGGPKNRGEMRTTKLRHPGPPVPFAAAGADQWAPASRSSSAQAVPRPVRGRLSAADLDPSKLDGRINGKDVHAA
jgi:hypothetical protein